jgi:hypothetical protein
MVALRPRKKRERSDALSSDHATELGMGVEQGRKRCHVSDFRSCEGPISRSASYLVAVHSQDIRKAFKSHSQHTSSTPGTGAEERVNLKYSHMFEALVPRPRARFDTKALMCPCSSMKK